MKMTFVFFNHPQIFKILNFFIFTVLDRKTKFFTTSGTVIYAIKDDSQGQTLFIQCVL